MTTAEVHEQLVAAFRKWLENPKSGYCFRCERTLQQAPDGRLVNMLRITSESEVGVATVPVDEGPRIVPANVMPPARVQ